MENRDFTLREIFHFRYGICQMVYFGPEACWVGLNEKDQPLWAPDCRGHPDMEQVRKPSYLYQQQIPYLTLLNPAYKPTCKVIPMPAEPPRANDLIA